MRGKESELWKPSFKEKILSYHNCILEYRSGGLYRSDIDGNILHVNHHAKRGLEKDLRKLGLGDIKEAVEMGREKRDERIKKLLAVMMYNGEKILDPIELDYQYEELKKEVDADLEKKVEKKIDEWKRKREKKRVKNIVEDREDEWKKGVELKSSPVKERSSRWRFQSLIGYWLFWQHEDREVELGKVDQKFLEQLESGDVDIYFKKALKDLGVSLDDGDSMSKIDEGKWMLKSEKVGGKKNLSMIETTGDGLRVLRMEKPEKRVAEKELLLKVPAEKAESLEFLKDFKDWDENGSWNEEDDEVTIRVEFLDYVGYKEDRCEKKLKEYLERYDGAYLDENLIELEVIPDG